MRTSTVASGGPSQPSASSTTEISIDRFKCDLTRKLSSEELASCFRFLGLRDLISASHVSRFWRSSALAFQDLWSRICFDWEPKGPADILDMTISRAGMLPVELEYDMGIDRCPSSLVEALARHMHRFVTFTWHGIPEGVNLSRPAPLLREFVCGRIRDIPRDFLGGCPGRLRVLRVEEPIFPPECPALATVTELCATYLTYLGNPSHFDRLFSLFPRLETLYLRDGGALWSELPAEPAPRTLKKVILEPCQSSSWNVVQLYDTWQLEFVRDVELKISSLDSGPSPAFLFRGATELSVPFDMADYLFQIHAALPDARRRTVIIRWIENVSQLADILLDDDVLEQTHTLELPLSVLGPLIARSPHWPHLTHLTIHVLAFDVFEMCEHEHLGPHPRSRRNLLDHLRATPALESLTLHVHSDGASEQPTLSDAQALEKHLSALSANTPREVRVLGFPGDVVSAIMPHLERDSPKVLFV